jgi:uncharacterized protein (DUF362 family)
LTVAIKKVNLDIIEAVSEVMDSAHYTDFIPKNKPIYLKVNLGWDLFIPGSVTNPAIFEGVVKKLKGYAREIYVVESNQVLENIEKAYRKSKISKIARELEIQWINLSNEKKIEKIVPTNRIIKHVIIPEILTKGVIVTIPVMKTHGKTTVTLSLKNQWGCIPKMRHMYHLYLDEAISDVNMALGVRFAVVDGTIAMEGNAPKTGIPREINIVGAGGDLVEVDSVFAKLMGFNPWHVSHIVEAYNRGLGKISTEYIGDSIDYISPFKPAGHNLVSKIELFFRKIPCDDLVFKTPLFWGMIFGAKTYYYIFEAIKGQKIRKDILKHSIYGKYF